MSELSERLAVEHKRVWNRLNLTCLCGWETTDPPIGDRRPFIAHVAEVTEAAVRETIAADIEAKATQVRATSDKMHRALIARESVEFDADAITRYAAYAHAWESAARIVKGEP